MNDFETWCGMLKNGVCESEIDEFIEGNSSNLNSLHNEHFEKQILNPGGSGILGRFSRRAKKAMVGHFEVTKYVLNFLNVKLEEETLLSFARAARLPDLLFFADPRYHAQTSHDAELLPASIDRSLEECSLLLDELTSDAKKAFTEERGEDFIFLFGLCLHLVQDIATHQGMTNPEHAFLDKAKQSPDLEDDFIQLSIDLSLGYVKKHFLMSLVNPSFVSSIGEIRWFKYATVSAFLEIAIGSIDFLLECLPERNPENISRWFNYYDFCHPEDLQVRIRKLFPSL